MQKSDHVLVVGGGTMGAGIAEIFLETGLNVCVVEVDAERVLNLLSRVRVSLSNKLKRQSEELSDIEIAALVERSCRSLECCTGSEFAKKGVEPTFVIETVYEDLEVKSNILRDLQDQFPKCRFFASNTSSISIDAIGSRLPRPERLIGMHFFNPVPRSSLIELVTSGATSDATLGSALQLSGWLGRESIVVKDSPGFATSRLGVLLGLEAIRMLEEGVASAQDIDKGMMLGYKLPVGPLKLTDIVGLDVRLAIAQYLEGALGTRFSPPGLLIEKVARGELGKKSGLGFFEWRK